MPGPWQVARYAEHAKPPSAPKTAASSPSRASATRELASHMPSGVRSGRAKLERLFGMSLDDLYQIMSWPIGELDPFRLSVRMQVTRTVFTICMKACLDGRLGREAARERDRQRIIEELARLEFRTSNKA